ncbi:transposase [Nonomuraea sp. NPDC049480]|uniref:transposase n=1 Tax=Nonomuraea sp. NPDC049480 TaxID=3364353 RepID=UPI0037B2B56B
MERRWVGLDGYEVVSAVRAGRQVLRVRRNGWVVADCSTVAEVAEYVDLADLCEVIELPAQQASEGIVRAGISSHHR